MKRRSFFKGFFLDLLLLAFPLAYGDPFMWPWPNESCPPSDPWISPPGTITNFTMSPIIDLQEGSRYGEIKVTGASDIRGLFFTHLWTSLPEQKHHNFSVHTKSLEIEFDDLNVFGHIDVSPLSPDTLPSGNFSLTCKSSSKCRAQITNFFVEGRGTPVFDLSFEHLRWFYYFTELEIDHLSFDELSLNFGDVRIDGKKFNVQKWSKYFKTRLFRDLSKPEIMLGFVDKVRQSINSFIWTYPVDFAGAFFSRKRCIYHLEGGVIRNGEGSDSSGEWIRN